MENRLNRLPETLTETEAMLLEDELKEFGQGAGMTESEKQRLVSSVMRKAGIDMKETTEAKAMNETKRTGRKKLRRIAVIAAAAVLMTTAVTAGASVIFGKSDSVDKYLGEGAAEKLETVDISKEETFNSVTKDDYSLKIDSVVRMADTIYFVGFTLSGETDEAKNYINSISRDDRFDPEICIKDSGLLPGNGFGTCTKRFDGFPLPEDKSVDEYGSISSMVYFNNYDHPEKTEMTLSVPLPGGKKIKQDLDLSNELYGSFDTTVPFADKDGRVLNVTPIGLTFDFYIEIDPGDNDPCYIEFKDGTKDDGIRFGTDMSHPDGSGKPLPNFCLFWKNIDLDSAAKIHFWGTDYYRQS